MSLLHSFLPFLQSMLQGGGVKRISSELSTAMQKGVSPSDALVQKLVQQLLHKVGVKGDVRQAIDKLDALIPDSFEMKFGITPQIKSYIRTALSSIPVSRS